ncbi:MAG: hypothetical protein ACI8PZ_005083 [Myxococcota bacterium]|jgi:hypothetical protein
MSDLTWLRWPLIAASLAAALPSSGPASAPVPEPIRVVSVVLTPPPERAFRWSEETAGRVTALAEEGLAELSGVVPTVPEAPPRPGLVLAPPPTETWTADLHLGDDPDALVVSLELCQADRCVHTSATATREAPEAAVVVLVQSAADRLGLRADPAPWWGTAPSADSYANLMLGRSAAQVYGLSAPVDAVGDVRRDPVARAVYLDPGMAMAHALRARRDGTGWGRGAAGLPGRADAAAAEPDPLEAAAGWDGLPDDPRFAVPRALAALTLGDPSTALSRVRRLPTTPAVAALRVAAAEALGESSTVDAWLVDWQRADPTDPEPVRRRVQRALAATQWEEARALLPELDRRGAAIEARDLGLALAAATERWDEAATLADSAGLPELATQMRAEQPAVEDADALVDAAARAQDPSVALALADRALAVEPWHVDALVQRLEALLTLGLTAEAASAETRLARVDPLRARGEG